MHEVARLIADSVIAEAKALSEANSKERVDRKQSADWFDQLVVEREAADRAAKLAKRKLDMQAKRKLAKQKKES